MAPPRICPGCKSTDIKTDFSMGSVVCQNCGIEFEQGILVSEIGFAEGSGGRVHVQGSFVSHGATGISGFRGSGPTSEGIKEEGRKRIQLICQQMGILPSVQRGAQRFYSLAVDNKFNRGRRTDYVVASCIYLYSRFEKDALMLIDFSERLQINVYELGATYLKLRSALNLDQILPEIDPAVYNIRFANRLDFGNMATVVARDASRLIKRFKADWMTSGRRPAGICGACLVIAARMSDFLRTPEEVAQVVKVSPLTIKKRLMEFAHTSAANKTVDEWRALTDAQLEEPDNDSMPPIMKKRLIKEDRDRNRRQLEIDIARRNGTYVEPEEGSQVGTPASTRAGTPSTPAPGASPAPTPSRPNTRKRKRHDDDAAQAALRDAARSLEPVDGDSDEDAGMDPLAKEDYVADVQTAGDNSQEAKDERRMERRSLMASYKAATGQAAEGEDDEALEALAEREGEDAEEEDVDEDVVEVTPEEEMALAGGFQEMPLPDWDDKEAVYEYVEEHIFSGEEVLLYGGNKVMMRERIDKWLQGRSASEVIGEMRRVEWARHEREWFAKHHSESAFDDLDDSELDAYWVMDDDERQARARMWLSHNGKWLEEDKERQERKAAYNRAHGIDPNKPKPKKKRQNQNQRRGPYTSAREAIDSFASQKKFSSRINMDAIRKLETGLVSDADYSGLQTMDDKDDDDEGAFRDDKEDGGDDDDGDLHDLSQYATERWDEKHDRSDDDDDE